MGIGLSLFRLESTDRDRFRSDISTLPGEQLPSTDGTAAIVPYSLLRLTGIRENSGEHLYDAVHLTETQTQPIRAFLNEARTAHEDLFPRKVRRPGGKRPSDLRYGYQEIHHFPVVLNFATREMHVYHRSDVADALFRRLMQAKRIHCSRQYLDLKRAKSVPGVETIYGAWTHRPGPAETRAYFGDDVTLEPNMRTETTRVLQIAYNDEERGPIDITLSADCKIGSRTNGVTPADILRIYRKFERHLQRLGQATLEPSVMRAESMPQQESTKRWFE